MKQQFSDERLEAIFSKLSMNETEKLKCPQGNEVSKLCTNSECQNALICNENSCKSCGDEVHPLCSSVSFTSIKNCLKKKAKHHKEFLYEIFELESKFMGQIYKRRSKMIREYEYNFVGANYRNLLIEIFDKKNNEALNGQKAQQFHYYLKGAQKEKDENIKEWVKQYQTYLDGVQAQITRRNQIFFEAFGEYKPAIDSEILIQSHTHYTSQMHFLQKSLGKFTKIDLLFRGSEHAFSAQSFHEICASVENTLTLVKTNGGRTVAGFTKAKWIGNDRNDKKKSIDSFLLQLDNMEKYVPKHQKANILCNQKWGPCFGFGGLETDLAIGDKCNITCNSCSNFPAAFNRQKGKQFAKNDQSCQAFIGVNNGKRFLVQEYEVFKVIYE